MINRPSWLALCATVALAVPVVSFAQLNLSQFGLGGANHAASADAAAQPATLASLVQGYLGANQQVLSGQSSIASAMGMGSVASKAQSAASMLSGGSVTSDPRVLSQVGGTQQAVSQSLIQAFSKSSTSGVVPTASSKQTFSDGLASLGKGVSQYAGLQSNLGAVKNSMSATSLLQAASDPATAQAATYIAQSAPGQFQSLLATLTQAVQFAQSNSITVPSAAMSALGAGL
jgi:hypothetical protein